MQKLANSLIRDKIIRLIAQARQIASRRVVENKSATGISSDDAFVRLYFLFSESYSSYSLQFSDRAHYNREILLEC